MKQTTFIPSGKDIDGNITGWTAIESGDESSNNSGGSGGGFGISEAVSDGITFATIIIILAILLLPLSPIWYFMTRNKIKKIKSQGKTPNRLLSIANTVTKITFILQIISLCIAIIVGIISLILGVLYLSNFS